MCRLLGAVTRAPARLDETLADELPLFAALSEVHCDGWGLAWWDADDDLVVRKEPHAANTSGAFAGATAEAVTDTAILHLRKASVGMATSPENTHPFSAGGTAFAHNGFFTPMDRVEKLLVEQRAGTPLGDTDSERYYALVLSLMRDLGPVDALHAAARSIAALSDQVVGLNALLLTQHALYAFAWWDEEAQATAESTAGTYELRYRADADQVVVASDGWEPPPGPRWSQLGNGQVLEVTRGSLHTSVRSG